MTTIVRTTGNTQFVAANSSSQVLTFTTTGAQDVGQLLINVIGANTCYFNVSTANTVTATIANATTSSQSIPVTAVVPVVLSTGQQYNQAPGNIYVAVISSGTASVFVTPVAAA
jgi:hypothetical protein